MLNRSLLFLSALSLYGFTASAQDVNEALQLGNQTVQGTARSMGFGNTLGSIGADFSALSVNPAGIGIYRSSEFTFTPSLRINTANAQYQGFRSYDDNTHFNINNLGLVFTNAPKGKRYERRCWKAIAIGIGFNRVADFHRDYYYQGRNTVSSASQAFEADANQYPADVESVGSPGYIGYQSYLLNYDNAIGKYYSVVPFRGGVDQTKSQQQRGKIDEYVISLGGNYKEKLMLGVTLGLTSARYEVNSVFSEAIASNNTFANPDQFSRFDYSQFYRVTGGGINLKLGAIYKISDIFRLGAAIHSPTAYALSSTYSPYMNSYVRNTNFVLTPDDGSLAENIFDYGYSTPWKGVLSAAAVLKGIGFLTVDYEYVGYGSMGFYYPYGYDNAGINYASYESAINNMLHNTYSGTSNVRVGAEGLITKSFMARAGFGYYGSPYRVSDFNDGRVDVSLGIGYRGKHFFTDLAWVRSMYRVQENPYSINYSYVVTSTVAALPVATTDFVSNNVAWTVGVKF